MWAVPCPGELRQLTASEGPISPWDLVGPGSHFFQMCLLFRRHVLKPGQAIEKTTGYCSLCVITSGIWSFWGGAVDF